MQSMKPDPEPNAISGLDKLWRDLAAAQPAALSSDSLAAFRDGAYTVPFLDRSYRVDPEGRTIAGPEEDELARDPEFRLLILGYLTGARGGDTSSESPRWVSERQLPGGSLFFQGPHALPVAPLVRRFGTDAEGFRSACGSLGGTPLEYGDASFGFLALPLVPLAVILWTADEEFPARAGMLFDPSVSRHLALDLVLALARAAALRITAVHEV
jgi:hypothetical protein